MPKPSPGGARAPSDGWVKAYLAGARHAGEGEAWQAISLQDFPLTAGDLATLLAAPQMSGVTDLMLDGCGLEADGIAAITTSPVAAQLRTLGLPNNPLSVAGTAALDVAALAGLVELDLSETGSPDVRREDEQLPVVISRLRNFGALRVLGLRGLCPEVDEARALARWPAWRGLERLDLRDGDLDPELVAILLADLPALEALQLGNNGLGNDGCQWLAQTARLPRLVDLSLTGTAVGDGGVAALAASSLVRQLQALDLYNNRIGDRGAVALAGASPLPALTSLDLSCNAIGDEGIIALSRSGVFASLTELALDHSFGKAGMHAFARAELSKLDSLRLPCGYPEMYALGHAPHLPEAMRTNYLQQWRHYAATGGFSGGGGSDESLAQAEREAAAEEARLEQEARDLGDPES